MSKNFCLNTGFEIPLIGFGTWLISDANSCLNTLDAALNAGYRLIDTADFYENEHHIGAALEKLLPKYNLKREDIFLTTKLIPWVNQTEQKLESLVRKSVKNFRTTYIDCYLIHWPGVTGLPGSHPDNKKYRIQTWKTLTKLQKEGLIRSVGVSNYMVNHLEEMREYSDGVLPAVNQCEWHPYNHNRELLEYCRKEKIFFQAYSSLGTSATTALRDDPIVIEIAKKLGKTPAQVLLRWAHQQGIGIIPKASAKERIEENILLDFEISQEDINRLYNIKIKERFEWNPETVA